MIPTAATAQTTITPGTGIGPVSLMTDMLSRSHVGTAPRKVSGVHQRMLPVTMRPMPSDTSSGWTRSTTESTAFVMPMRTAKNRITATHWPNDHPRP